MQKLLWIILLFPFAASAAETIVLNGLPNSKVVSNAEGTERENLVINPSMQSENRILITKKQGKYLWSTRENRELFLTSSGVIQIFIDPLGGGYIEVWDAKNVLASKRPQGKRFEYKEHLRMMLGNITYWGEAEGFNP